MASACWVLIPHRLQPDLMDMVRKTGFKFQIIDLVKIWNTTLR
ncbi:hypothetical protein CSC43_4139 [Pseudomonas aeruginosa]|nr:hypothetical protein CSC43_4139 [Pseudomonas aeruginosa]